MNSFLGSTPAQLALRDFDRVTALVASSVANRWPDAYPDKPVSVPGAEILDENGNSYDPPQYASATTAMVPDLAASQAFWDQVGSAGFPLCVGHAILGNGANFKHLLAGGTLDPEGSIYQAGLAMFGAALQFRAACEAAGLLEALPVRVLPPLELAADSTGKITVSARP